MPEDETLASPEAVDELSMSVGISKEALKKKIGCALGGFWIQPNGQEKGQNPSSFIVEANSNPPRHKNLKEKKHRKGQKKVPIFLGFRSQLAAALAKICSATGQSSAFFHFLFPLSFSPFYLTALMKSLTQRSSKHINPEKRRKTQ